MAKVSRALLLVMVFVAVFYVASAINFYTTRNLCQ